MKNHRPNSGNQSYLKHKNRSTILNLLRSYGSLSRSELARISGLNKKTITNIINHFLDMQVVVSSGLIKSDEGRKKEHVKINSSCFCSIGIEIAASHISIILLNLAGNILLEKTYSFRFGLKSSTILEKMLSLTEQVFAEAPIDRKKVLGIGVSAPGLFNKERDIWNLAFTTAEWNGLPLVEILRRNFHTDVYLQDSSRAMAFAELWYGAGKEQDNFVLVDIGQHIGMGIVIDRKLYEGSNLKSGEIGHLIVDPDGRACTCGNRGCLESVASGTAIAAILQERIRNGERSRVSDLVNDHIDEITAIDVVEAANMKDAISIEVLRKSGQKLGRAISFVINLFNPGMVILSGELSNAGSHLIDPLIETVGKSTPPNLYSEVVLRISRLGYISASLGAASIAINNKLFILE
jgi:N-acetylglucosamine repressor